MTKKILFVILLTFYSCSTKLNLRPYLGEGNKETFDFSINRISQLNKSRLQGKITVFIANNKYVIITPNNYYSEYLNQIGLMLNSSYFILDRDLPELLQTLNSIKLAFEQELMEPNFRVIKYSNRIYTGTLISNFNTYQSNNIGSTNGSQSKEEITLLNIEFIAVPKLWSKSEKAFNFNINNKEINLEKDDLLLLIKDLNNASLKLNVNLK